MLLIGYGNTLRSDDGVGPKLAEAAAGLGLPGLETLVCALLTPELAEPISRADRVVFVDAAVAGSAGVELREISPAQSSQLMAHAAEPRTMLALARDVFGHAPFAWLLTIPVENMELGETLSPLAQSGLSQGLEQVRRLVLK
ncbi:MAG TPA: hydrogenase maturation protease [Verrucomicrobiae bacterium]|nr:hydrogenase maturation protease [Verrucomicrobiae bacterium]